MRYDDYDYDYHNLANNCDDLYDEHNEYNDSWDCLDAEENEITDSEGWDNYYHNIANEIVDE